MKRYRHVPEVNRNGTNEVRADMVDGQTGSASKGGLDRGIDVYLIQSCVYIPLHRARQSRTGGRAEGRRASF
jgi:hypothetical protein